MDPALAMNSVSKSLLEGSYVDPELGDGQVGRLKQLDHVNAARLQRH